VHDLNSIRDLAVRDATEADSAAIAALAQELGYPTSQDEMVARLGWILAAASEHGVLVAVTGGAVVGWINVSIVTALESGAFAEIRGLIVTESQRGKGIGERLVSAGEAWAVARGMRRMRVRTNVLRERTHTFYERAGYAGAKTQRVFDKVLQAAE
jgi:GNAT superfamily N-acetyltransferase